MKSIKFFMVCVCVLLAVNAFAYETTPADFDDDELMAADRFNDWNEITKKSLGVIQMADLMGEWKATSVIRELTFFVNTPQATPGWEFVRNLYYRLVGTVTFHADGDGTYRMTTSYPNPFSVIAGRAEALDSNCDIINNMLFVRCLETVHPDAVGVYRVQYINPYVYILSQDDMQSNQYANSVMLEKRIQPPDAPKRLHLEAAGYHVTLLWDDDSDNEAGFNIYRKDGPSGAWRLVGSAAAGAVEYRDPVPGAGKFFYRVRAYLMDGETQLESRGSNVEMRKFE